MFNQTTDLKNKSSPQLRKECINFHKSKDNALHYFQKQREKDKRKRNKLFSRSKSPLKTFNHLFKANQNRLHPNKQPSFYTVNYYSRNSYASRNRSSSKNRLSYYQFSRS